MWFYYAGQEGYNWIRYAESADGSNLQVYEDSSDAGSGGKNYLEFSGGSGNEMSVLYRRGGTGIIIHQVTGSTGSSQHDIRYRPICEHKVRCCQTVSPPDFLQKEMATGLFLG